MEAVTLDESVLDTDDPPVYTNPIFEDLNRDHDTFYMMCGFSEHNFLTLYELLERLLTKPKRGRKVAIGPIDGFLLFLHWLRTAAPIDSIAGVFNLRPAMLYKTLKKIAMEIHGKLAECFIATPSRDRWREIFGLWAHHVCHSSKAGKTRRRICGGKAVLLRETSHPPSEIRSCDKSGGNRNSCCGRCARVGP
jgi:hypothetical protein